MTRLAIRSATASDLDFVRTSWAQSYQMSHNAGPLPVERYAGEPHVCPACGAVSDVDRSYWPTMMSALRWLLARDGVRVLVAHEPSLAPPDDVIGYLVLEDGARVPTRVRQGEHTVEVMRPLEQPLLHYVYVKQHLRMLGVARRLFDEAGIDVTRPLFYAFSTATAAKVAKRWPSMRFDPRLARFPKDKPKET